MDLIGSFTPTMREADDACFAGASLLVDTDEALQKSGDLLGPLSRGTVTGRQSSSERTVFKSVGTALEDLGAASLVFESGGQ